MNRGRDIMSKQGNQYLIQLQQLITQYRSELKEYKRNLDKIKKGNLLQELNAAVAMKEELREQINKTDSKCNRLAQRIDTQKLYINKLQDELQMFLTVNQAANKNPEAQHSEKKEIEDPLEDLKKDIIQAIKSENDKNHAKLVEMNELTDTLNCTVLELGNITKEAFTQAVKQISSNLEKTAAATLMKRNKKSFDKTMSPNCRRSLISKGPNSPDDLNENGGEFHGP